MTTQDESLARLASIEEAGSAEGDDLEWLVAAVRQMNSFGVALLAWAEGRLGTRVEPWADERVVSIDDGLLYIAVPESEGATVHDITTGAQVAP